jgi:hypothetical protein
MGGGNWMAPSGSYETSGTDRRKRPAASSGRRLGCDRGRPLSRVVASRMRQSTRRARGSRQVIFADAD